MTAEQGAAKAHVLTRIWLASIDADTFDSIKWNLGEGELCFWFLAEFHFKFKIEWDGTCLLEDKKTVRTKKDVRYVASGALCFDGDTQQMIECEAAPHNGESQADFDAFADKWLAIFKRNLWLVGAPLDVSAHERMEWSLWFRSLNLDWNAGESLPPASQPLCT